MNKKTSLDTNADRFSDDTRRGLLGTVGTRVTIGDRSGVLGITMPPNGFRRDTEACGIAGHINIDGKCETGRKAAEMLETMVDRENGLGAGYACYGLFPKLADYYCIQLLLDDMCAKESVEAYFKSVAEIVKDEKVYTQHVQTMKGPYPLIWRFFIDVPKKLITKSPTVSNTDDYIVDIVMHINEKINGAFCVSSGKNMAVFKGNGWSYEIAEFFDIANKYKGYMWLAHSRFPTNTPGWWGGAHPFNILDTSVCHNGEITSYGTNKRYVDMWGYKCTLLTDSEVLTYIVDLLCRRHKLPKSIAAMAMAPRYYDELASWTPNQRKLAMTIRMTYRAAMVNGPFSILVGTNEPEPTFMALTDRKKLRPMTVAESEDGKTVYAASEECAFRRVKVSADTWASVAGNPVIAQLGKGLISKGIEAPFMGKNVKVGV
ncbi:MAG: class II glutamine amidotransferase [Planctomycetota bacterium]|jgi:glutamate synthase domain-containing protein 1